MTDSFRVDEAQYAKAARTLRGLGPDLKNEMKQTLFRVAKPAGHFVAVSAGRDLPQRGGLGYAIGGARVGVTANSSQVAIRFNVSSRWYLARIDDGTIRHPVFGRKKAGGKRVMVDQKVRPGSFRRPFDEHGPVVQREVLTALDSLIQKAAAS